MATLINNSTGNFTTAATWSLVDATSFLNSETNTTASTTAFVGSQTFVPGAITIDGIAVKVSAHTNPGTGTFSTRLFNTTAAAAVAGTTVTINVTDLPIVNTSTNNGWVFMKFAAPVLLLVANSYRVEITSSVNATVTLYRDATAANWSRALRTTTTQAPTTLDMTIITGEYISAGSNNTFTVTMNNADAGATTFDGMEISAKGILSWGTAASTNYYLKVAGNQSIYTGGVYNMGTSSVPVPSTSTAKLEFANTVNVQFGMEVRLGATFKTGGNPITNSAFLTADAAAAATSLTTNVSTGWKSGDVIGLASTTRTRTETETKALTADAVGTTLTITALTNAHSGTSPTAGELINLTRNVQIFGTSTTNQAYINIVSTAIADIQATEFYNLGSATVNKRGIDIATTTGTSVINNCSIHDCTVVNSIGVNISGGASNNYTVSNSVFYNIANSVLIQAVTTASNYTLNNLIGMLNTGTTFSINDLKGTITNLTAVSATTIGITITESTGSTTETFGTLSGFVAHANGSSGVTITASLGVTNNPMGLLSTFNCWRNTTVGFIITNSFTMIIDGIVAFGNATANVQIGGTECDNIILKNMVLNAGTTLTSPIGLNIAGDCHEVYVDNSTFGVTTTHATADVVAGSNLVFPRIVFRNCLLNSTTPVSNTTLMTEGSFVSMAKFQQTAGNHKTFKKYGTITTDTVIFNSGPVSSRLTPNNAAATDKLQGGYRKIAVPTGQTATIKVFIRKSVAGDGTAYNGNQPRLMLRVDPAAGVNGNADVVLGTVDNTYNGVFKALTATTPAITDNAVFQVYIDCDGTLGWVNVDDWSVS